MPKNQTGSHAIVPKRMGKGPKYPFAFYVALVLSMTVGAMPVLAAGDPLAVINNLSTFIFWDIYKCCKNFFLKFFPSYVCYELDKRLNDG